MSTAASAVASDAPSSDVASLPKFSDLSMYKIHPNLLNTLTQDLGFEHMTPVQAATFPPIFEGNDVLAQAKTGTGKTVAFLLPAIQKMITRNDRAAGRSISLLVISPTRELAMQIAAEAKALLKRFPGFRVSISVGGTNKNAEEKNIMAGCDILVGTPGRLHDHLSTGPIAGKMSRLDTLVLDEADRLLDMGFLNDLKRIIALLPDKLRSGRQGMLFSATIADYVAKVANIALGKDYKFISTIPKGEPQTHERVPQQLVIVPEFADMAAGVVGCLRQELKIIGPDAFKAIVFAPTAQLAEFYIEILGAMPDIPRVVGLHSRMSQPKRTKITDEFRKASAGILVATDVVARGMDFPGVSNVIQTGLPMDKESYIHRLGRTARAGAEGRGTFIVTSHESFFPQRVLKSIDFNNSPADLSAQSDVIRAATAMEPEKQGKIYQAWLGYYKTSAKQLGWSEAELVQKANEFALNGLGAVQVPTLYKTTVGKMGLKGVPGLRIIADVPHASRGRGGGGGRR